MSNRGYHWLTSHGDWMAQSSTLKSRSSVLPTSNKQRLPSVLIFNGFHNQSASIWPARLIIGRDGTQGVICDSHKNFLYAKGSTIKRFCDGYILWGNPLRYVISVTDEQQIWPKMPKAGILFECSTHTLTHQVRKKISLWTNIKFEFINFRCPCKCLTFCPATKSYNDLF